MFDPVLGEKYRSIITMSSSGLDTTSDLGYDREAHVDDVRVPCTLLAYVMFDP